MFWKQSQQELLFRHWVRKRSFTNGSSIIGLSNWKGSGALDRDREGLGQSKKQQRYIKFRMLIRQLWEDVKQATGYMSLEKRGKGQDGHTHLEVLRMVNVHQQNWGLPEYGQHVLDFRTTKQKSPRLILTKSRTAPELLILNKYLNIMRHPWACYQLQTTRNRRLSDATLSVITSGVVLKWDTITQLTS